MKQDCSAYVMVYNDWDILADSLRAIAPYVSEIVIVDGGYVWMRSYLEAIGLDPAQSDPNIERAAESCGVPVRIITGLWQNEIEKRMAGYQACTTRYVFRVDADEILVIDDAELNRFFATGGAVGQMEIPICVAPGLIRVDGPSDPLERAPLLFDTQQVSAASHLHLLWLVLGPEGLPAASATLPAVHPEPIAFAFHLTGWRTPATSIIRASFYTLNYARQYGLPWINHRHGSALCDLSAIFARFIDPMIYRETLLGSDLVINIGAPDNKILRRVPARPDVMQRLRHLHYAFLMGLAELNQTLTANGRHFVNGEAMLFDLSSTAARLALASGDAIAFTVSQPAHTARVEMRYRLTAPPWQLTIPIPYRLHGDRIELRIPDPVWSYSALRQVLCVELWCTGDAMLHRLLPDGRR
jgi:hypothetical protein